MERVKDFRVYGLEQLREYLLINDVEVESEE